MASARDSELSGIEKFPFIAFFLDKDGQISQIGQSNRFSICSCLVQNPGASGCGSIGEDHNGTVSKNVSRPLLLCKQYAEKFKGDHITRIAVGGWP